MLLEVLLELVGAVVVLDHLLVVEVPWEVPDVIFIQAVVDQRHVRVRWVRKHRLALDIVERKGFIIVLQRDH